MRPLELRISAFGPYAGETVIPMHELGTKGLYLITGDTGAGKTTIFDAICYALFGEPSGDSRDTSMLRSKYAEPDTPTEVELAFAHNGKEYRVVRNPEYERPAKRGDGFTKQVANACLYLPDGKTVTKLKDVTTAVENLLGINREQFSQIAMIAQGDFKKLLLADTKQRQEIFRELFKTAYYQKLQNALETKRKDIYGDAEDCKKSINQYIRDISVDENDILALDVDKAKKGELDTEDIIDLIEKLIRQDTVIKEKKDAQLSDIYEELEQINERIGAAETVNRARESLKESEEKLKIEIPIEETLKKNFEDAKTKLQKKDELTGKAVELGEEISKLDQIEKMQIDVIATEAEIAEKEKALDEIESKKFARENTLNSLKKEFESIKDVTTSIEKLKNQLEKTQDLEKQLEELVGKSTVYKKELVALESARKKYADDNARFVEVQHIYEAKDQAFRDGQAGILAASLVDGQKCPVCGSLSHPQKAHLAMEIPSEKELEEAKSAAENAREKASESSNKAHIINKSVEIKLDELKEKASKLLETNDIDNLDEKIKASQAEIALSEKEIREKLDAEVAKANRKKEIEKQIPATEKEIKDMEMAISSDKEDLAGKKASALENKKQIEEMKKSISFSNKVEAENKKNELEYNAQALQKNYDEADEKLKDINNRIVALHAEIENCKKTLEGARLVDIEAEKARKEEFEKRRSDINNARNITGSRLDRNKSILNNIKTRSKEIVEIEKQLQWVSALADTANGKLRGKEKIMLETYIQTTYFDRIISRANLRFMKMSGGQYELKRQNEASNSKSQSGLELGIIDHYNGSERSVKTLSGGESFMASLSLALGLSDEVQSSAGGIQVDTMFVDEGFGSLDADSLDQAYKALASLTEGNRLVGIISHVAELKNKIDSQVIVKKEKSGGSLVSIQK